VQNIYNTRLAAWNNEYQKVDGLKYIKIKTILHYDVAIETLYFVEYSVHR
jgi:hypothetical protein